MYVAGLKHYLLFNKPYKGIIAGEDIEGDTFETLEQWQACPYKYEIMAEAMKFKEHLRKISYVKWFRDVKGINNIGLRSPFSKTNTPILTPLNGNIKCDGEDLVRGFEDCINGRSEEFNCPPSLENTELGHKISLELNKSTLSENIFCHMALYYKSFVVKDNKLIGIRNWQYAGYYPPEFEDIVHRYLEYI